MGRRQQLHSLKEFTGPRDLDRFSMGDRARRSFGPRRQGSFGDKARPLEPVGASFARLWRLAELLLKFSIVRILQRGFLNLLTFHRGGIQSRKFQRYTLQRTRTTT